MILEDKTKEEFGYDLASASAWKDFYCQCDYCDIVFLRPKRTILLGRKIILKECCKTKECINKKREESQLKLYGVPNYACTQQSKDKVKSVFLDKYGVECASKSDIVKDKIKNTNLKKYGKTSYLGTEECKEKNKKVSMDLYGVDNFSKIEEVKKKAKETSLLKYGVDHYSKTEEYNKNKKETCQKKYGVDHVMFLQSSKDKQKITSLEKYGVDHPLKTEEVKRKIRETCLEKYGVDNYSKTDEFKTNNKKIFLEKYGVDHPLKTEEVKRKIRETCMQRYGFPFPTKKIHVTQNKISEWLNSFGFNFKSDYDILNGKEIDLLENKLLLGIEYCGLYWHNELSPEPRLKNYHFEKYKLCKDKKIRLITIFEDEWVNRNEQCKNYLKSILNQYDIKYHARNCEVKSIDSIICNNFLENNHILGKAYNTKHAFGLYNKDNLLAVISFGDHHRNNKKNSIVLNRLCFSNGVHVSGGASKLFKNSLIHLNQYSQIITWSDNRWTEGNVYPILGFRLDKELSPDYSYVNINKKSTRLSKQSQKTHPKNISEKDYALSKGLVRIWDCGKKRWIFNI